MSRGRVSSAPTSSSAASPTGLSGTGTKREVSGAREPPLPSDGEEEEEEKAAGKAAAPWRRGSGRRPARRSSGPAQRLIRLKGSAATARTAHAPGRDGGGTAPARPASGGRSPSWARP